MKIILETDYYNLYENEEGQKIIIKKGDWDGDWENLQEDTQNLPVL
jgi:hypothetical protein